MRTRRGKLFAGLTAFAELTAYGLYEGIRFLVLAFPMRPITPRGGLVVNEAGLNIG